jgi:zinc D-Ala-D-Ala dipeptidase
MKGLVSLNSKGFVIDQSNRKDWAGSERILVRKSVAEALLKAKEDLPKRYNFKIWDGKRSVKDQRRIVQICEKDFKKRFPKDWQQRLIDFTGGYEDLKRKLPKDTHREGGAIDLTIVNEKGRELLMGKWNFDKTEALNYYERKKNLAKKEKEIRDNRRLLKKVLSKHGFKPYLKEWCHWELLR